MPGKAPQSCTQFLHWDFKKEVYFCFVLKQPLLLPGRGPAGPRALPGRGALASPSAIFPKLPFFAGDTQRTTGMMGHTGMLNFR